MNAETQKSRLTELAVCPVFEGHGRCDQVVRLLPLLLLLLELRLRRLLRQGLRLRSFVLQALSLRGLLLLLLLLLRLLLLLLL